MFIVHHSGEREVFREETGSQKANSRWAGMGTQHLLGPQPLEPDVWAILGRREKRRDGPTPVSYTRIE